MSDKMTVDHCPGCNQDDTRDSAQSCPGLARARSSASLAAQARSVLEALMLGTDKASLSDARLGHVKMRSAELILAGALEHWTEAELVAELERRVAQRKAVPR